MSGMGVSAPAHRGQTTLGGLVPSSAVTRSEAALVAALAVEHHAEGAALPLLVLSMTPGMLAWDPEQGLAVTDDAGTEYRVTTLSRQAGLGSLQVTAWLEPAVPVEVRDLHLRITGLVRVSSPRGGLGIPRPLQGGEWRLDVPLRPQRTAAAPPPQPPATRLMPSTPRVPARALTGFLGLVPVGQARLTTDGAVCLWCLERYTDRTVLTLGVLRGGDSEGVEGQVRVWDDRGGSYGASLLHETSRDGWTECSVELVPALDPAARALGVRLSGLDPGGTLQGPFVFGVQLPEAGA